MCFPFLICSVESEVCVFDSNQLFKTLAVVLLGAANAQFGTAQCQSQVSDSSFAASAGSVGFSINSAQRSAPFPYYGTVNINRVVGPGTPLEFDSNGFLTDASWNTYVQNGVLSAQAWLSGNLILPLITLRMPPSQSPMANGFGSSGLNGRSVSVYVNDKLVNTYSYPLPSCIPIPTKYLKFAQRVLNQTTPIPAENRIAFTLDFPNPGLANENNTFASISTLSFQAMAPVIMVHGWNSGPWWWGPSPSRNPTPDNLDGCGPDLGFPHDHYDGGFDFIQPFVQAKIPFSCQVVITSTDDIKIGASELEQQIKNKAAEFGAKHVHLVGHSKGGLWIRAVLPKLQDDNLGVYSVTSLDTPHHGSSLADLLVGAHKMPYLGLFNPRLFLGLLQHYNTGADDLRTTEAPGINAQYPDPTNLSFTVDGIANSAQYFSVAADADLDGDGQIENNEWSPYRYTPISFLNGFVANYTYDFLGTVQSVRVSTASQNGKTAPVIPPQFLNTLAFQKNDLLVTVASARFDGFTPIQAGTNSYFGANHKTVGNSAIAQAVIQSIQSAQPQQ